MCVCIYICIYVYVYIFVHITSAYMYMYQRVRLRSSHAGLQWHVPSCMYAILVYHCNKQASNVFLSIQFDTNVSQLLRRVLPWSYDPLPSLGELSSSSLNRLSVCLSCLFWLCNPPHRNGTLDRGLDTKHAVFVTRGRWATSSSILLYFKIRIRFVRKNNVIEIVLSCFLIFKIKETKDYVTSPRAWTCDI